MYQDNLKVLDMQCIAISHDGFGNCTEAITFYSIIAKELTLLCANGNYKLLFTLMDLQTVLKKLKCRKTE